MSKSNSSTSSGLGLASDIFIVFLILKLTGVGPVANWSWWWVTSPLWLGFALVIGFFVIVGIFYFIAFVFGGNKSKRSFVPKKSGFQERLEESARKREQAILAESIKKRLDSGE